MNNSEKELELIYKFGIEAVIKYAEMLAFMYDLLYIDAIGRGLDNNEFAYNYERDWWLNKCVELEKRMKTNQNG